MFSPSNFAAQPQNRLSPFSIWYQWAGVLLLAWLAAVLPAHAQAPVPASVLGQPVQQVVSGTFHTCAVTTAGAVQCWGNNAFGQLGDGTNTDQATPQPVTGLGSGVVAIAAGQLHTCALTTAGAVQCWGANVHGQLGDSSTTNKSAPQPVTGFASGVAAIAAGEFHTCALTTAGAVQCWGRNVFGQLGDGTTTSKSTPQPVAGMASAVAAISGGTVHTCALTTAGAVHCWGTNNEGQLGDGSTTNKSTPQPVTGLASGVAAIAAGGYHTCALTTAGATQCWGSNAYGQLGNGNITSKTTPQPVIGLANGVAAIAAGENHTCALSIAGAVQCWGYNDLGQLGDGSITAKSTPQPVTGLANGVAAIAAGENHTCALTTAGAVQCWGFNDYGQLGDGRTTSKTTPQPVAVLASGVATIAVGLEHTCALTTAGTAQCWGGNYHGQLGDGSTTEKSTPQPVTGLGSGVAAIAAGLFHTCALTTAGAVQCWGHNNHGQLGDGSTTGRITPQPVPGLTGGVAAIAGGGVHTCALTTAGAVQCWGHNNHGQLGDGSTTDKSTPQPVTGLASGVAAIAAGQHHTCALTTAGAVQCWGFNDYGQLGDGSITNQSMPQPVTGLVSGVAAIAAGRYHTCALTTAGAAQCWGWNNYGQLGDGSTTDNGTPQPVTGLGSGMAATAAGLDHTCALTMAGAVQCWGHNDFGQLGDGSTTNKSTPQPVTGLASGVEAIAAGGASACALTAAGALQCWGSNSYGQLGNGDWHHRRLPARIAAAQVIDFPVAVGSPASGASTTLAATASSGLAVAFDTFTPNVCTVTGSTLTVLPGKTGYLCGVLARQAGGLGSDAAYFAAAPSQSRLLRVAAGGPGAPTAVTASAGNAQATVAWTAPASDGGSTITAYTVAAVADAGKTCTVTTGSPLPTTCTVPGLTNGTPYTFTVKATNAVGDSLPSLASAPVTPTAPVVIAPPAEDPGPTSTTINTPGSTTTITNPSLPVVVGPGAGGGTIVLPGTGTTPVTLQVIVNGKPLTVQALPGTQLRIAEVNGQSVLVLVVLEGWASMASSAAGQPMVLAGPVLLSSGSAGTLVEAQPLAVAVQVGSLTAPAGSLPALGSMGLQAGERLQVNDQGAVVAITLGSLKGDTNQPGDPMAFANLPASLTVDNEAFARLNGPLARLSGANMAQGLEVAPSGVFLVRDGGQVFQLLPTQPITIDARLPDGMDFTPLGLLRWVRGGVVVQFAPAVADLAGLASAVTAVLPDAQIKLGAEGVLQLRTGGPTYVLKPDWTGAGTATGTPQIRVYEQGRIYLQTGQGARQLLLPALLNATQASSIVTTALPGAVLAVQPGSSTGAFTLTLAGQAWRLVPQWVLPSGSAAQVPPQAGPWWMGADGLLYLKLGTQVQGMRISD